MLFLLRWAGICSRPMQGVKRTGQSVDLPGGRHGGHGMELKAEGEPRLHPTQLDQHVLRRTDRPALATDFAALADGSHDAVITFDQQPRTLVSFTDWSSWPADQRATGTMKMVSGSGTTWCDVSSMIGDERTSAPQLAPSFAPSAFRA